MKVPQWCVFNWWMDAASQMFVCHPIGIQDLVFGLEECENSHTLTTTTTGTKNPQKEVNNQIDIQTQFSVPPMVPSLQALGHV